MLKIDYRLPNIFTDQGRFVASLDLFPHFSYYVNAASITVVPPEGAHFVQPELSSIDPSLTLSRALFQETLQIDRRGLSYVDRDTHAEKDLQVAYDYNSLWLSLRPTLWIWGLSAVGSVVTVFMRRPKTSRAPKPPKITMPKLTGGRLSPDLVKTFVDSYEERSRVSSEKNLLVTRAQKGKIPRRQYKVQRKALELRIGSLSKSIDELKATFSQAGGNYAGLVRQLDAAEGELNISETNMRSTEARHRTGELPLEDYKKSMTEYERRKEKAESAIKGILLRLREETR
jgi:hypothetical protein